MAADDTKVVIGVDLGDRWSQLFVLHSRTGEIEERRVQTTSTALNRVFCQYDRARVALEVSTHSPWVSRLLEDLGHEVVVANPRMVGLIHGDRKKDDRTDAQKLCQLADYNPELLAPVTHRSAEAQAEVAVLRARDVLVASPTKLINHVRGAVKSIGGRIPKGSAASFATTADGAIPEDLKDALAPVLRQIGEMTSTIKAYDKQIETLGKKHPETERLRQVAGVGPITALAFVLLLGNPIRFRKSRDVGPYIGLVSRRHQTGSSDPELRITKAGDVLLRRLLVQSAQYILGPHGPECDLRTWGLTLASRGRKNAKKRAVVATARKLSVLLHRMWVSGDDYQPLRHGSSANVAGSVTKVTELEEPKKIVATAGLRNGAFSWKRTAQAGSGLGRSRPRIRVDLPGVTSRFVPPDSGCRVASGLAEPTASS
jgi:transposase